MPPMDRRPPLAVSPRHLRPRRNLRSAPPDQTPSASIRAKPMTLVRSSLPCDQLLLRPEFQLISSQLMEMAKRAKDEFAENDDPNSSIGCKTTPLFERGRFYEEYSARRNERLKRKQGEEIEVDEIVAQDPGIAVELAKRRNSKKKTTESLRKSVPANFSASRASSLRSSVRSSKEIKKAAAGVCAALGSCEKKSAAADVGRRIGTRSLRRI